MRETVITAGDVPIRALNQQIRAALAEGQAVTVRDTRSRHNLGIGLPVGAEVSFEGSVGYYCGGFNNGARIEIERAIDHVFRIERMGERRQRVDLLR